jgi:hypothetical protein
MQFYVLSLEGPLQIKFFLAYIILGYLFLHCFFTFIQ